MPRSASRLLLPPGKRAVCQQEWGGQETLAAGRSQRKGSGIDRKRNTHWLERAWEGRVEEEHPGAKICSCNPMYGKLLFQQEHRMNIQMHANTLNSE